LLIEWLFQNNFFFGYDNVSYCSEKTTGREYKKLKAFGWSQYNKPFPWGVVRNKTLYKFRWYKI